VRRELMQCLFATLHGTLGSYLRKCFAGVQCRCCGMPSCSSGFGFFLVSSLCLMACAAFSCKKRESILMKYGYYTTVAADITGGVPFSSGTPIIISY
jgi:hypothetical protein